MTALVVSLVALPVQHNIRLIGRHLDYHAPAHTLLPHLRADASPDPCRACVPPQTIAWIILLFSVEKKVLPCPFLCSTAAPTTSTACTVTAAAAAAVVSAAASAPAGVV